MGHLQPAGALTHTLAGANKHAKMATHTHTHAHMAQTSTTWPDRAKAHAPTTLKVTPVSNQRPTKHTQTHYTMATWKSVPCKMRQGHKQPTPLLHYVHSALCQPLCIEPVPGHDWTAAPQPRQRHPGVQADVALGTGPVVLHLLLQDSQEPADHLTATIRLPAAAATHRPDRLQHEQPQVGPEWQQLLWWLPDTTIIQQQNPDIAAVHASTRLYPTPHTLKPLPRCPNARAVHKQMGQ